MVWTPPADWTPGETPSATKYNQQIRDNMKEVWRELVYVQYTTTVSTTTATEASPLDVVSAGAVTFTAEPIMIHVFIPGWNPGGGAGAINLWDGSTDLGRLIVAGTSSVAEPASLWRRLTPTAAAHTYKARIWTTGGATAAASVGAGGTGLTVPGFIRIMQKGSA